MSRGLCMQVTLLPLHYLHCNDTNIVARHQSFSFKWSVFMLVFYVLDLHLTFYPQCRHSAPVWQTACPLCSETDVKVWRFRRGGAYVVCQTSCESLESKSNHRSSVTVHIFINCDLKLSATETRCFNNPKSNHTIIYLPESPSFYDLNRTVLLWADTLNSNNFKKVALKNSYFNTGHLYVTYVVNSLTTRSQSWP